MTFSELTTEQKNATAPVYVSLLTDKNLYGFVAQVYELCTKSQTQGSPKEQEVIINFYDCVSTIYHLKQGQDIMLVATQAKIYLPMFFDFVCSDALETACKPFEYSLVWYNILQKKCAFLVCLSEVEAKTNKKRKAVA
ncbi:hypothetical protein WAF17_04440 [Bernardetia sp. ABR2-2B]|uniref:hypothetical protein n=1 Tax=Bernardetia sp. ABR2-2B TaxID=3127472 RepID=UPI0030D3E4E1